MAEEGTVIEGQPGWRMHLPPGFQADSDSKETGGAGFTLDAAAGGDAASARQVTFVLSGDPQVEFSWAPVPGLPVERRADAWIRALIRRGRASPAHVAAAMSAIYPPVGEVVTAGVVSLPGGIGALESVQRLPGRDAEEGLYLMVSPLEPQDSTADRQHVGGTVWFADPATGEPLDCLAPVLHRSYGESGCLEEYLGLGHPRYHRVLFWARQPVFDRWLEEVARSARTLEWTAAPDYPWESPGFAGFACLDDWLRARCRRLET